jgi:hypothetical protein
MAACKQCGADASGIACEFCGAIQAPPKTLEDEIAALDALAKAAQHVVTSTPTQQWKGNDSPIATQMLQTSRLAAFWGSAWMPSHPDALVRTCQTALAGASIDTSMDAMTNGANKTAEALLARAEAAIDALEMAAPADPRVAMLRAKVAAKKTEMSTSTTQNRKKLALLIGLPLALLVGVPLVSNMFGPSTDADAPIPQTMQGNWARTGGAFSYTLRVAETSLSARSTATSTGQSFDEGSEIHQQGQGGLKDDGTFEFRSKACKTQLALADTNTLIVSDGCGARSGTWTRSP